MHTKTRVQGFHLALPVIANNRKQPPCQPIEDWIREMWCVGGYVAVGSRWVLWEADTRPSIKGSWGSNSYKGKDWEGRVPLEPNLKLRRSPPAQRKDKIDWWKNSQALVPPLCSLLGWKLPQEECDPNSTLRRILKKPQSTPLLLTARQPALSQKLIWAVHLQVWHKSPP